MAHSADRSQERTFHADPLDARRRTRRRSSLPGSFLLTAYDPADGKRLWWVGGLSFEMKSTPIIKGDTLYINGFGSPDNDPGKKVAILTTERSVYETRCEQGRQIVERRDAADDRTRRMGLGFADLDGDKMLSRDEWDYYKAAMESDNGMLAIRSVAAAT